MRIIKPYGRSVVAQDKDSPKEFKRQLEIGARVRETTSPQDRGTHDVYEFLSTDADFFIAQWASMLNKLLNKPYDKGSKPTEASYKARDLAGKAFLAYWQEHNFIPAKVDHDKFIKQWFLKVHPYGNQYTSTKNTDKSTQAPRITGRWYKMLGGEECVTECDWEKMAVAAYRHLYEQQKKYNGTYREQGLIETQANSISKNAKKYTFDDGLFKSLSANEQRHLQALTQSEATDWAKISASYKLDPLINDLHKKVQEPQQAQSGRQPRLPRQLAIACLSQQYARVFGEQTKIADAKKQTDLWLYHCMIKEALYFQYPIHPRQTPRHTINADKLHNLAVAIETNRQMAFAIRLGKVIHYQGGIKASDPAETLNIINSPYWTSKGQTTIKQNESFVRQWLEAIAIANSTLDRLLNPEGSIDNDLLVEAGFAQALARLEEPGAITAFDAQFKLLFGKKQNFYDWADTEQRLLLVQDLRNTLKNLRNASFHFKKIDDFKIALKQLNNKSSKDAVNSYINKHQNLQKNIILKTLAAAHIETYLSQTQVDSLMHWVLQIERSLFPLPKFNKLLLRAINTRQGLIPPANAQKMKNPAYQCCFISLKMLYDRGFSAWLETQYAVRLNQWITQAKARATAAAKNINGNKNDDIVSKMARLRKLDENETLLQYFSYLGSETAVEFQVQQKQSSYQPGTESTQEPSNFVEQFKQDVLILGLNDFIKEQKLECLYKGNQLPRKKVSSELPDSKAFSQLENIERPWLYLVLHLMPIEFVNQLTLQLKKHRVLTCNSAQEHEYEGLYQALSLYLSVHDAIHDNQSLNHEKKLMGFYAHKEDFIAQFKQKTDDGQLIPMCGLREVLRFANLQQLEKLFSENKVEHDSIVKLNALLQRNAHNKDGQSDIALAQHERTRLHDKLSKQKPKGAEQINQYKEGRIQYQKHLQTVIDYRGLKNQVYLHNPKQAHQLIMATLTRLLGFSQIWERDIYFTLLTLFMLRQIKLEQYHRHPPKAPASLGEVTGFMSKITEGQIFAALCKMSEFNDSQIKAILSILDNLFAINKQSGECQDEQAQSNKDTYNNLVRFNMMREEKLNLTRQINKVRLLVSYDRKLKNAVSKSIIELLERHNLIINFKMENHQLKLTTISAKSIYHLGTKPKGKNKANTHAIEEKLHSDAYVEVVKRLFK